MKVDEYVSRQRPLEEINEAFDDMAANRVAGGDLVVTLLLFGMLIVVAMALLLPVRVPDEDI